MANFRRSPLTSRHWFPSEPSASVALLPSDPTDMPDIAIEMARSAKRPYRGKHGYRSKNYRSFACLTSDLFHPDASSLCALQARDACDPLQKDYHVLEWP